METAQQRTRAELAEAVAKAASWMERWLRAIPPKEQSEGYNKALRDLQDALDAWDKR